ncbi:MAG: hypothetical protein NC092_13265, partial [Butyrivibrio sp.]|nr:hypothetical protein [Muribaculum sp.]MCM1553641.1 hypothetical protein [Butyrivibrio sp.]
EAVKMNILEIGIQHGIEQGKAQGLEQGIAQGVEQGKVQGVVETCQELGISQGDTLLKLMEKFFLTKDAAKEQLNKYWH